jgi:hypothetical protein
VFDRLVLFATGLSSMNTESEVGAKRTRTQDEELIYAAKKKYRFILPRSVEGTGAPTVIKDHQGTSQPTGVPRIVKIRKQISKPIGAPTVIKDHKGIPKPIGAPTVVTDHKGRSQPFEGAFLGNCRPYVFGFKDRAETMTCWLVKCSSRGGCQDTICTTHG